MFFSYLSKYPLEKPLGSFASNPTNQPRWTHQGTATNSKSWIASVLAALEDLEDGFLIPGTPKKALHFRRNIP